MVNYFIRLLDIYIYIYLKDKYCEIVILKDNLINNPRLNGEGKKLLIEFGGDINIIKLFSKHLKDVKVFFNWFYEEINTKYKKDLDLYMLYSSQLKQLNNQVNANIN